MKTYQQFSEDIGERRQQLHQRSVEQMKRFRQKSKSYADAQQEKRESEKERERLKSEIESDLRSGR